MTSPNPRVVIIGGGASGLAAASKLAKAGLKNLTLLEAADRLGGRIHSFNFNGHEIELGAQWVHGQEDNIAFEIAERLNIIDDPNASQLEDLGEEFYLDNGEWIEDSISDKYWDLQELIEEKQEDYEHGKNESVGEFFDKMFKLYGPKPNKRLSKFKDFFHRYLQSTDGCDNWYDLSYEGSLVRYKECEGNEYVTFKTDSKYYELLDREFIQSIPESSIRLNSKVSKVKKIGDVFQVQVDGGETLDADFVIMTVSLGVLKQNLDMFEPDLPFKKVHAIEKMGMGLVSKIYLEYEETWWPKDSEGFGFIFNESSNYTKDEIEQDWTRAILGIYQVLHRDKILTVWLAGIGAKKAESLDDDQVLEDVYQFMRKFLKNEFPKMPRPIDIEVSRWGSNPLTLGTYSYHSLDTIASGVSTSDLAEPVGKLLFAGEATHPHYFSTVHGAIESGYREADRILECI